MAKYTQTSSELLRAITILVINFLLPKIVICVIMGALIVGLWSNDMDATSLFMVVGFSVAIGVPVFFVSCVLVMYYANKRVYDRVGYENEVLINDDGLTFKTGSIRSEVPYSLVKKAIIRQGLLLIKLVGGNIVSIPMQKFTSKERRKLLSKLGIEDPSALDVV